MKTRRLSPQSIRTGLAIIIPLDLTALAFFRWQMWERKGDTLLYDRINHTIYQFNQQADRDHFADSLLWSKTFQSDLLGTSQIQRASDYLIDSVLASKADSQMHYQKRYGLLSPTQ